MTLSIKMRKRKSDATSAFECSAWPLIGVSSERQIAYAQICYFLLSDKQTKAPRQETAQFTETAAQHSREAADGLNQDKVRFWFTVRERLSALPHLQCLLHDGFTFLLLHFHIVNRHVAANHSTELRQWCGSVELQARTYKNSWRNNKGGGLTISWTSAWCPSSDRAAPQRFSPSAPGL